MTQQPFGYPAQPGYPQQPQQPPYGGGYPAQPGYPAQQPPAAPQADPGFGAEDYFTRSGSGIGGPSFKFEPVPGSGVLGLIVDQKVVAKTQPNNPVQQVDKNGVPLWQLRVVLQTNLRNWEGVSKLPTLDDGVTPQPPQEDTGLRSVYVWYTMRDAVEAALQAAGATSLAVGMELGVKVVGLEVNKMGGNPIKQYAAVYRAATGAVQPAPVAAPVQQQFIQPQAPAQPQAPVQPYQPGPIQQFAQAMQQPQAAPPQYAPPQYAPPGQQTSAPPF